MYIIYRDILDKMNAVEISQGFCRTPNIRETFMLNKSRELA